MGDIKTISERIILKIQFRITILTIYKNLTIIQNWHGNDYTYLINTFFISHNSEDHTKVIEQL